MVLRLKRKCIPLKGIPIECSPFAILHEEEKPPPKGSPPTCIRFIPVETG